MNSLLEKAVRKEPITVLDLRVRTEIRLHAQNIFTIGQLLKKSKTEVLFATASRADGDEIIEKLAMLGFSLKSE